MTIFAGGRTVGIRMRRELMEDDMMYCPEGCMIGTPYSDFSVEQLCTKHGFPFKYQDKLGKFVDKHRPPEKNLPPIPSKN